MRKLLFGILITSLITTACLFKPSNEDRTAVVLARVDGRAVTAAELDSLGMDRGLIITDSTDVGAIKAEYLDTLIDLKIFDILRDSLAATLDNDRTFAENRDNEVANTVFRLMFEGEITKNVHVDSAEIDKYYEDHKDQFKQSEQVKASHILIPPPPPDTAGVKSEKKKQAIIAQDDKETLERAEAVLAKAKAGENWDSLVVKYSQDATNNKRGGDLGYFVRGRMVPEFDSAAFSAGVGEIVGPVKTKYGYHIIKIEDKKAEGYRPLDDEARKNIETNISNGRQKELADKFVDSLKAEAVYSYNEEVLAQPDSALTGDEWVVAINGADTVYESRVQKDFPKYLRFKSIKPEDWTVDNKKDMLKDIAVTYLLRSAGRDLGYYKDPKAISVRDDFTMREADLRAKNFLRDLEYKPSEEEIEQYYNANFDSLYKEKKPLHVQHIIFEDSSLAQAIRDSLVAGADFKQMALKYYPGEKEIREVAYDLGYISEDELGPVFFEHANQLKVGEISEPFKTEWGYHVVKLVDRRQDKKIDQVRPSIRKKLTEAADKIIRDKYMSEKRAKLNIVVQDNAVKKYKFPESLYSVEINP